MRDRMLAEAARRIAAEERAWALMLQWTGDPHPITRAEASRQLAQALGAPADYTQTPTETDNAPEQP